MAISESQLETWSHRGPIQSSSEKYNSVRAALLSNNSNIYGKDFDVFLQGSYGNDTNIYGDSDVDIVVQLHSTWHKDLSKLTPAEAALYTATYPIAIYQWQNFYDDIVLTLKKYYGERQVNTNGKVIKLLSSGNGLHADIVASTDYRIYYTFRSSEINTKITGIKFNIPKEGNREVVNYPQQQKDNNTKKHQNTSQWYKPTVRIFKNFRNYLIKNAVIAEDLAPSYFLEGLIYNIPNGKFGVSYQQTVRNCLFWLKNECAPSEFFCQNGLVKLFGNSREQWSEEKGAQFLNACILAWDNYSN